MYALIAFLDSLILRPVVVRVLQSETPCLNAFWQSHPYILVHLFEMFFLLVSLVGMLQSENDSVRHGATETAGSSESAKGTVGYGVSNDLGFLLKNLKVVSIGAFSEEPTCYQQALLIYRNLSATATNG